MRLLVEAYVLHDPCLLKHLFFIADLQGRINSAAAFIHMGLNLVKLETCLKPDCSEAPARRPADGSAQKTDAFAKVSA
jgi:hypothetical protein